MIIKFLPVGTGDPKRAVSYLLGEIDHKGDKRADVKIIEGDPFTFSALAESVSFKYRYTSAVIAWAPQDHVTDENISEVISEFKQHIGAGLEQDQYHMTVIMHSEDDGSRHLHILIPRIELKTGKSFNVAPPSHRHYFDPLRDYFNYKYDWIRPDDVTRINQNELPLHLHFQDAKDIKANLDGLTDQQLKRSERVKIIDRYVLHQINLGAINNRKELVNCLKKMGKVTRQGQDYISLEHASGTDRLRGKFYGKDFSFSDHQINQKRLKQSISENEQQSITEEERLQSLGKCFKEMHRVRGERAEYNQKYYCPKISQNEATIRQVAKISYELGVTVSAEVSREIDDRYLVDSIPNPDRDAVSKFHELHTQPTTSFERFLQRDNGADSSNTASESTVLQRAQVRQQANNGVNQPNQQWTSESGLKFGQAQQKGLGSTRRDSSATEEDTATVAQNYIRARDVWRIQYPHFHFTIHLNIVGVKNERNTVTSTKKSINFETSADGSSIRETAENRTREESESATDHRCADSINQRTRELTKASAQLARDIEERKLSLKQNIERQRVEAESTREYIKALSRRDTERNFMEAADGFIRKVRDKIQESLRRIRISMHLKTQSTSPTRSADVFPTLFAGIGKIGFDLLVTVARGRIKRQKLNDNLKEDEQQAEFTAHHNINRRVMSHMSDELKNIQVECPQFNLKRAIDSAMNAEEFCNKFYLQSKVHKLNRLDLDAYVFYIGECLDELKAQFQILGAQQLELLERFSTVIELHLDQLNHNNMNETSFDYQSAQLEVKDLVKTFRYDLINKMELFNPNLNLKIDKTIDRPGENSYDAF